MVRVRESQIEWHLVKRVEWLGGMALKFTSPGRRSVPDRIVLMPGGVVRFVEVKAPGEVPTPAQEREHARLRAMGFCVCVLDDKKAVDAWLDIWRTR